MRSRGCRAWLGIIIALLWATSVSLLAARPGDGNRVVQIRFDSQEQLAELAGRLDVWEVDHAAQALVAYVSPSDAAWLANEDFPHSDAAHLNTHPNTIPGFPCYRTVAELDAQLHQWAIEYAPLTSLFTIGDSYEGRPLWVMRLTNPEIGGDKPVFFLIANIHGRELITNETAMQFIESLLKHYGTDPNVTWVLDHHAVYVLVTANPDGHVKNEPGQPWAWWRKNTQPYGNCGDTGYGVDLNRNSSFNWGGIGASTNPCHETYRGPSAASEPETQAIQDFILTRFPDQRGPGDDAPAPDDATGVFITLHSYGNLVLWPWGNTYTSAPNGAQLRMLGTKMAYYNGYTPGQSSTLYPTTGATDDWVYGELGVAAYTFEIGSSADGFYPSCSRYDALIEPNLDAIFYAATVARTPYITSFGPDTVNLEVASDTVLMGEQIQVQAVISDTANGNRPIAAAEVYVGTPPWDGGTPQPLLPVDGTFDTAVEAVWGNISTRGVTPGRHLVYARGRDVDGYWGPVSAAFVDIVPRYALSLEPARHTLSGFPGEQVTHTLGLSNLADLTDTITITHSPTQWPTAAPSTVTLMAGESISVTVTVTIPREATLLILSPNIITLTVTSAGDPSVARQSVLETRYFSQTVFLPLIVRGPKD